jgi:hypothetical protein
MGEYAYRIRIGGGGADATKPSVRVPSLSVSSCGHLNGGLPANPFAEAWVCESYVRYATGIEPAHPTGHTSLSPSNVQRLTLSVPPCFLLAVDVASKPGRVLALQLQPNDTGLHGAELAGDQHQMLAARASRGAARQPTSTKPPALDTAESSTQSSASIATAL